MNIQMGARHVEAPARMSSRAQSRTRTSSSTTKTSSHNSPNVSARLLLAYFRSRQMVLGFF